MSGRRGGLGRGISSLIPTRADRIEREREAADAQADAQPTDAQPTGSGTDSTAPARAGRRPVDVFFAGADAEADDARPSRSAARAAREMAAAHRDPEGRFHRSTRRVRPAEAAAPTQDAVAGQASTTPGRRAQERRGASRCVGRRR
jgi:ParB family transcriptional regulator, chromosome partitioning protein